MLTGKWPGKVFPLDRDEMVIGKRADCDITLPDQHVSKSHARIVQRPGGLYIENLENTNETKVNGVLLEEPRRLADGDLIKICKYILAYELSDVSSTGTTKLLGTIDLSRTTSRVLAQGRSEEKLRVIMDLSAELVGILDLTAVLEKVLNALFLIFPDAERGFILFPSEGNDTLRTRACRFRHDEAEQRMPSRTVYNLVTGERQAVLIDDVLSDSRLSGSKSVGASQVHSIMGAPLLDQQRRPIGVLQVDTRDRRNRFKQGDLDFLVAAAGTISMAVEGARLHEIEVRHRKLEQEARDAWTVQRSFIPGRCPVVPGYESWHVYEPARFVGGDYLDYRLLPGTRPSSSASQGKRWAITVGDVSGKGMPAALLMARISTEVRLLLQVEPDPTRVVGLLNRSLFENEAAGRFVTFLLILLDARRHQLTIVNAGHMGPLIRRAGGRLEVVGQDRSGPPLGVVEDQAYEAVTAKITSGDVVVLYTDGLTDALSPDGQPFGSDRLERCLATAPPGASSVGQAIQSAVRSHTAARDQFDDITLICLGRS
jgi:serine phosphatase RsbU (regulator of sigma subunit)/pSer/pThr/pTyr-binding forkhead associated (FHA) protein